VAFKMAIERPDFYVRVAFGTGSAAGHNVTDFRAAVTRTVATVQINYTHRD